MKSMERFGEALVSYEGVASVGVPHPEGVLEIQGYFEAAPIFVWSTCRFGGSNECP